MSNTTILTARVEQSKMDYIQLFADSKGISRNQATILLIEKGKSAIEAERAVVKRKVDAPSTKSQENVETIKANPEKEPTLADLLQHIKTPEQLFLTFAIGAGLWLFLKK